LKLKLLCRRVFNEEHKKLTSADRVSQTKNKTMTAQTGPYGLDYPPDLEGRVLAAIARNSLSPPAESSARFRTQMLVIGNSPVDSSDEEEEFVCTPVGNNGGAPEPYLTQRGPAETLYLLHNSSQLASPSCHVPRPCVQAR
jgi:hypothetical protein